MTTGEICAESAPCGALCQQSFYTVNGMDCLAQPGLRLGGCVPGLFVSQDGFVKRGLCLS